MKQVFLGLGGNVGDVEGAFVKAIDSFISNDNATVVIASPIYRTPPWGVEDQPDYLNAVLEIGWDGSVGQLADFCQMIERSAGRDRRLEIKWGPRPLDIDILVFEDMVGEESGIKLPHPRMQERKFVLQPLSDIAPDLFVNGQGKSLRELLDSCDDIAELVSCQMSRDYINFTGKD